MSRALAFDLIVDGVAESDVVTLEVIDAETSEVIDSENVDLQGGRVDILFSDARAQLWPLNVQIKASVTRQEDGRTRDKFLSIDGSTTFTEVLDATADPVLIPANGSTTGEGSQVFTVTPDVAGYLYRLDVNGVAGEFTSSNTITASVPNDGRSFDVVALIDKQDGRAATVINHSYTAFTAQTMYSMLDIARAESTAYASSDEAGNNRIDNYTLDQTAYIWIELVDTNGVHINDQDLPFGIRFGDITLGSEGFDRQEGTYSVYEYNVPNSNPNNITPTFTAGVYTDSDQTEANALIAEFTLPIGAQASTGYQPFDIQRAINSAVWRNSTGGEIIEFTPGQTATVSMELTDTDGNLHIDDVTGHSGVRFATIDIGNRGGVSINGIVSTYQITPPSSNSVERDLNFTIGVYLTDDQTDNDALLATVGLPLAISQGSGNTTPVTVSDTLTYSEIRAASAQATPTLDFDFKNPGDAEYAWRHLGEYLWHNPSVRYWVNDESGERISAVPRPQAPSDAIVLPAPSGGNDASAIRSVLDANPGASFTGLDREYDIGSLSINNAADIFDMKVVADSTIVFDVKADDVRFFNVHIDCSQRTHIERPWQINDGVDRTHIVDCSVFDYHGKNSSSDSRNFSAVIFRGLSRDYHIVGNSFKDLIHEKTSSNSVSATCRANPFLWGGASGKYGGGVIANNEFENFQSTGTLDDAECFTLQNGSGVEGMIYTLANRGVNAGKRLWKIQHNGENIRSYSDSFEWRDRSGPLGSRKQLTIFNFQHSADRSIMAHPRLRLAGEGRWDELVQFENTPNGSNSNCRFQDADVEIVDNPPQDFYIHIVKYKKPVTSQPTGNSFSNVHIRGSGSINYLYDWNGCNPSRWDRSNNRINVPINIAEEIA